MPQIGWDWLLYAFCALGFGAVFWHVFIDDSDPKTRHEQPLQRRLTRYPASARAVLIRGRPEPGWKQVMATLLVVILAFGMPLLNMQQVFGVLCEQVGAAKALRALLLMIFPGTPLLLALVVAPIGLRFVRILRGGYAPPLDSAPTRDTIAVSGWRATLRGLTSLIVISAIVCWIGYVAYDVRQSFEAGNEASQMAHKCPGTPSSKSGTSQ